MDWGFWAFVFTASAFFALGFWAKGWLEEAQKEFAADEARRRVAEDLARESQR